MFKQRLIILVSAAVAARVGGWTRVRCWVLGACAVSGKSGGSWGTVLLLFQLSCRIASVVLHMGGGGSGGLWGGGIHLCLGSWFWGWISWEPLHALGLVMALSFLFYSFLFTYLFLFYFRAPWFGLGLSFDWSFPLYEPYMNHLYEPYGHVITGDLSIIPYSKLRDLIAKARNTESCAKLTGIKIYHFCMKLLTSTHCNGLNGN